MRRSLPLLLAGVLAWLPAPAGAADVAQIRCPVDALSGEEREQLIDHVRRQGGSEEPAMQAFYRRVEACSSSHGWSDGAARQAIIYNLAFIGQAESRRPLEARGIDMAAIERALLADRAAVEAAGTDRASDALLAFYNTLDPAIRRELENTDPDRSAYFIGTFLLFRAAVEVSRAQFAAE